MVSSELGFGSTRHGLGSEIAGMGESEEDEEEAKQLFAALSLVTQVAIFDNNNAGHGICSRSLFVPVSSASGSTDASSAAAFHPFWRGRLGCNCWIGAVNVLAHLYCQARLP